MEYIRCKCTQAVQCFIPSIRRHSGIWGAADEAVLNIVGKKLKIPKNSPFNVSFRGKCARMGNSLKLPSLTKLAQLGHFPPASQAGRLAGPVFYVYVFSLVRMSGRRCNCVCVRVYSTVKETKTTCHLSLLDSFSFLTRDHLLYAAQLTDKSSRLLKPYSTYPPLWTYWDT
jgi:hypothetical protein